LERLGHPGSHQILVAHEEERLLELRQFILLVLGKSIERELADYSSLSVIVICLTWLVFLMTLLP
jgi:hypothetical protein